MDKTATTETFQQLHKGRTEAFGAVEGRQIKRQLETTDWENHLYRGKPGDSIGIYPLMEGNVVWFAATDIDRGHQLKSEADDIAKVFEYFGIYAWVEKSKGKGWHVWVHFTEPIPATTARAAFLLAHKISSVPATEVYPKQDELTAKKPWGNYINLPYAVHWLGPLRKMHDGNRVVPLEEFVENAPLLRCTPDKITAMASHWVPEPRTETEWEEVQVEDLKALTDKLNGYAWTILQGGPLPEPEKPDGDRSKTMIRLVARCKESGLTPPEALEILKRADDAWGKFRDRPDRTVRLVEIVQKGWT